MTEVNYKVGNETLIKVLNGAAGKLRSLLKKQGRLEHGALRVAVIGGGCSGLQYKMDLVDGPANRDILIESNEVRVVIDPKSALFVTGSELDYSDDLQQGGFKVTNPNAVVVNELETAGPCIGGGASGPVEFPSVGGGVS